MAGSHDIELNEDDFTQDLSDQESQSISDEVLNEALAAANKILSKAGINAVANTLGVIYPNAKDSGLSIECTCNRYRRVCRKNKKGDVLCYYKCVSWHC